MKTDMRCTIRLITFAGWLASMPCAGPTAASAQDALVLSGGGSRGLAHAGAITGLSRRGFQPDLVVGASMGAIIGGLYAAGVSPDSLWSLTTRQDWQELFAPAPQAIGPVWDARRPSVSLGMFVDRTRFTDGLIADWRVNRLLVQLFFEAGARAGSDFDQLPRRFRAVAADLRTGTTHVIDSGDLARAIRASMSVPGAFAPILWDGAPLVDGGLADYLPVGPARQAGGRRVVAVDVLRPPRDRVGLNPFEAALRSLRFTLANARQDKDDPDVAVVPDLDPNMFAAIFLRDPLPLLEAGLEAALAVQTDLGGGGGARPRREAPASLDVLRLEVNDPALESLVRATFERVVGRGWDPAAVLAATDKLWATRLFSGIWPRVERSGDQAILIVRADAVAPTYASIAGGFDADRGFRGWASIRQRIDGPRRLELTGSAGSLEKWASLSLRGPMALSAPQLGVDAGASVRAADIRIFADDRPIDELRISRTGGWLGLDWYSIAPEFELGVRLQADRIDAGGVIGSAAGPAFRLAGPRPNADIVGTPLRVEAEWRFGRFEYQRFAAGGSIVKRAGPFSAALVADMEVAAGDAPIDALPALGNSHVMPGLRWGRYRGPARALAGLDLALATPLESHLRVRLRTGAIASDVGKLGSGINVTGIDAAILWWTPLGRMAFDAGVTTNGDWRLGVDFGPWF